MFETIVRYLGEISKRKIKEPDSKQQVYKSLAEVLKGKRGRFRYNLLGKRVDYSGRSVIISGPNLALHQCGLPREIVLTLFQPFLIRYFIGRIQNGKKIQTRFQARQFLEQQTNDIWIRRRKVLRDLPVLLNRAPTLHRFGFQAFQPKLVYGRAIHIHPLVCSGFNADFDGDQIAVHVPLSPCARTEAWRLIISGSYLFSPATGEPAFLPSQDMILGTYYLTTRRPIFIFSSFAELPNILKNQDVLTIKQNFLPLVFFEHEEVLQFFENRMVKLHQNIWLLVTSTNNLNLEYEITIYEKRIDKTRKKQKLSLWHWEINKPNIQILRTTVGRIVFSSLFNYILEQLDVRFRNNLV